MPTASEQYLGCLMLDPSQLIHAQVHPESIDSDLKPLYKAMTKRIIEGLPVDAVNLSRDYSKEDWWPGAVKVSDLENAAVSAKLIKHYANRLKVNHNKARLSAWHVSAEAIINNCPPDEAITRLESGLCELIDPTHKPPFETFEKVGKDFLESNNDDNCILTGISYLDDKWYLNNGGLHIVAARTAVGKTSFACWLASRLLKSGKAIMLFSIEQPSREIAKKFFHTWGHGDARNYTELYEHRKFDKLLISDKGGNSLEEIKLTVNLVKQQYELGAVIIDYLQLVTTADKFRSIQEKVQHVSVNLKRLARDNNVPVIACAQVNREAEQGKDPCPQLHHLRDSGSIEQDADSVAILYRPEVHDSTDDNKGLTKLIIAKQRQRDSAKLECDWDRATGQWENWRQAQKEAKKQTGSSLQRKYYPNHND